MLPPSAFFLHSTSFSRLHSLLFKLARNDAGVHFEGHALLFFKRTEK